MSTSTWVIYEWPLTDDELTVPEPGYVLKGGYDAVLTYHTFRDSQSDDEHVRRFRSLEAAAKFIENRYGDDADWDLIQAFTGITRPTTTKEN